MNLREKVESLVRYCAQYQSHGYMMDERNLNEEFNILMPEEANIRKNIESYKVILLTGEAGDGKSRILRNIEPLLKQYHFSDPCQDFSALTEEDKVRLIERLKAVLDGVSDERLIILANIGVFTQVIIQYDIALMEKLTFARSDVYICNFENRNLAENPKTFEHIVTSFLDCDMYCPQQDCSCHTACIYKKNIEKIKTDSGLEAVRTICNALYLIGGHITFRELLSLIAYIITFGQDCQERRDYINKGNLLESVAYYNVFQNSDDALLGKISNMDPALKRDKTKSYVDDSKEEYIRYRRKLFFDQKDMQYELLNIDYLVEFHDVLEYIDRPPYYYDTIHEKNSTLQMLKRGINKINNKGKSDTGLIVTDTPIILGNKIRTEFLVMQDISMIWHRYDLQIGCENRSSEKKWNRFYLSYFPDTDENTLISLLIDYPQFKYLMMCSKDYFLNRNELTVEEYAVNTFYRKILQVQERAYDSIVIRFEEKGKDICDFSLTVHSERNLFNHDQKQTIRIRRED
ncbi:MAG: hypothetical protein HDR06_03515 [Lachnospiraceae bacterium]|nr:hypothetical protein [Lachnospiraceae bacterium]